MSARTILHCDNCGKEAEVLTEPGWLHIEQHDYRRSGPSLPSRRYITIPLHADYCGFFCATVGLVRHSPDAAKEVRKAVANPSGEPRSEGIGYDGVPGPGPGE
jgi:hypothetical protein